MRHIRLLALAACLVAPAFAEAPMSLKADAVAAPAPVGYEQGLYRFGATYSVMPSEDALSCQSACADNDMCKAWSFVAVVGETPARCELKRGGGHLESNPAATSGFSPTHEAFFSPVLETPVDELMGDDSASTDDHLRSITIEREKVVD
ncbi:PAN domain-containing protein [Hyphomonas oceanitis]|uniref:PAN domain-containing protein n=1 Tax=Hyphomonas oceanitis TaxID=81033 RepID=UPI00300348A8